MRRCLPIILFVLPFSGCSTSELLAVAEKERIAAERLYIAETLCMKYKEFDTGVTNYNRCIENVLGIDRKSNTKDKMYAGSPIKESGLSNEKVIEQINELPNTTSGADSVSSFVAIAEDRINKFDESLQANCCTNSAEPQSNLPDNVLICNKYNQFGNELRDRCLEIAVGSAYVP